ncbi:MAG TPA: LamG domain-containing protein, partial [Tissierellaceae bacterium]
MRVLNPYLLNNLKKGLIAEWLFNGDGNPSIGTAVVTYGAGNGFVTGGLQGMQCIRTNTDTAQANRQIVIPASSDIVFRDPITNVQSPFTVELWFKTTWTLATSKRMFGSRPMNTQVDGSFEITFADNTSVTWAVNKGSGNVTQSVITGLPALNDGQWHQLVFNFDPATNSTRLYVDAVVSTTNTSASGGTPILPNTGAAIGLNNFSPTYYAGQQSFAHWSITRIWKDRILTASEVNYLY